MEVFGGNDNKKTASIKERGPVQLCPETAHAASVTFAWGPAALGADVVAHS
jgi:hypothetical protein